MISCELVNKIRVCHIASAHPANDVRIFHKECLGLADHGYNVHLVAKGILPLDAKNVTHLELSTLDRWPRLVKMFIRSWRAYRLAKTTVAALFHFHDPELLPYGLLLKWKGETVIYDAHEDLPRDIMMKEWIPRRIRKSIAWIVEKIENYIARRLDYVVAATPCIAQRFRAIGAKVVEVKNYPKLEEFSVVGSLNKSEPPVVCYVGMISIPRGIIEMINAIELINIKLILAGSFIDSKTEEIARALPGWKNVDFRGVVSREEIANIYRQASVGLCLFHPSSAHNDALPNKLFEYMSAGLPVVCSNFPLWDDIIKKSQCGISVNSTDALEIRNAIRWMLDNQSTANQMGLKGRLAVEDRYNWQLEADRLIAIYHSFFSGYTSRTSHEV